MILGDEYEMSCPLQMASNDIISACVLGVAILTKLKQINGRNVR